MIELAREAPVRQAIYTLLADSTKDEKQQVALVLADSGDRDSIPVLEGLSRDPDPDVAAEGIRSLGICAQGCRSDCAVRAHVSVRCDRAST